MWILTPSGADPSREGVIAVPTIPPVVRRRVALRETSCRSSDFAASGLGRHLPGNALTPSGRTASTMQRRRCSRLQQRGCGGFSPPSRSILRSPDASQHIAASPTPVKQHSEGQAPRTQDVPCPWVCHPAGGFQLPNHSGANMFTVSERGESTTLSLTPCPQQPESDVPPSLPSPV